MHVLSDTKIVTFLKYSWHQLKWRTCKNFCFVRRKLSQVRIVFLLVLNACIICNEVLDFRKYLVSIKNYSVYKLRIHEFFQLSRVYSKLATK